MRNQLVALLFSLLLVPLAGCSWIFMTPAPDPIHTPNTPFDCTSTLVPPVLDTVCSGYFVLNGIAALAAKNCNDPSLHTGDTCLSSGAKAGGAIFSVGLAALCGVAASSGYNHASDCTRKKELNVLCISGDKQACNSLNPDWMPVSQGNGWAEPLPGVYKVPPPAPPDETPPPPPLLIGPHPDEPPPPLPGDDRPPR